MKKTGIVLILSIILCLLVSCNSNMKSVNVAVISENDNVNFADEITLPENSSSGEFFRQLCNANDVEIVGVDEGFITKIGQTENSGDFAWMFYINGELADVGTKDYIPDADDKISLEYVNWSELFSQDELIENEVVDIVDTDITSPEQNDIIENDSEIIETEPEQDIPENKYANETIESFFDKAAFVGDSVMHGMNLYTTRNNTSISSATFLTLTSFAARHALSDVTESSYHPLYNGQKMKVEDALLIDGANKVFIFFGLNDVRVTPTTYFENYVKFINSVLEKNPDIDIFVVSSTYPVQYPGKMDAPTAAAYRDQLLDLNTRLQQYCEDNNMYYIDVINPLCDSNGFLSASYSSDNYVHLTNKAYTIWTEIFEGVANDLITFGKLSEDVVCYQEEPAQSVTDEEYVGNEYVQDDTVSSDSSSDNIEFTESVTENEIVLYDQQEVQIEN